MTQDGLKEAKCVNEKRSVCNQSEVLHDLKCGKCSFPVAIIFHIYFSRHIPQSRNITENIESPTQDVLGLKISSSN